MYYYKVKYFDDVKYKDVVATGAMPARSYSEAVKRILEYYGEENIITLLIERMEVSIPGRLC